MTEAPRIKSLQTVFLEKPPCCMELCPANSDYFIVGTYNLQINADNAKDADTTEFTALDAPKADAEPSEQQRDGSLVVYRIKNGKIEPVETHTTPFGVLDMHFSPHHSPLLGVTTSTGSIALYEWCTQPSLGRKEHLLHRHTLQLFDAATVVTSLAWDLHMADRIHLSSTTGEITTVTLSPGERLTGCEDLTSRHTFQAATGGPSYAIETLARHDLEAWTVVATPPSWTAQGLYSGADDASIKFTPFGDASDSTCDDTNPPWSNSRIHAAGVVSILPLTDGILLTGSYDDRLRIIATPSLPGMRPQVLHELNLGGGVWRLKSLSPAATPPALGRDPSTAAAAAAAAAPGDREFEARILISGMYAGAFVVDVGRGAEDSWSSRVVARFAEHESMNYACEVLGPPSLDVRAPRTFLSCSFYDKRLCLWGF